MGYGWRQSGDELVELCDECGFDARGVDDENAELVRALQGVAFLLDHPDAGRRPDPETWSAVEYADHVCEVTRALLGYVAAATGRRPPAAVADLAEAGRAVAAVVPSLTPVDRAEVIPGVYSHPVTVGWVVSHLLHDVEHHLLDLRRNYARMALADLPGTWDAGRPPG